MMYLMPEGLFRGLVISNFYCDLAEFWKWIGKNLEFHFLPMVFHGTPLSWASHNFLQVTACFIPSCREAKCSRLKYLTDSRKSILWIISCSVDYKIQFRKWHFSWWSSETSVRNTSKCERRLYSPSYKKTELEMALYQVFYAFALLKWHTLNFI